jgi:hypothetical protein
VPVMTKRRFVASLCVFGIVLTACGSGTPESAPPGHGQLGPFLAHFHTVSQIASTVPGNGDLNPYGVAVVPESSGRLVRGDILVSNFNDRRNVQGTGTTIVEISPTGRSLLFAQLAQLPASEPCPGGVGLTVALGVLPGGWVIAGSLPTNKQGALPQSDPAGCLVVLSDEGVPVETFTGKDIDGPWDLTVSSTPTSAEIYVSDALGAEVDDHVGGSAGESNGIATGTADLVRLDIALSDKAPPELVKTTVIGKGFPWTANNAALDLAPTGLALGDSGTLYVDDTDANAVYAVRDAATRSTAITAGAAVISSGGALNEPLGMTFTPMDDLLIMNGNDGNAVEISPSGKQLGSETVIGNGAGDLIGLTLTPTANGILFGNDGTNALDLLH